MKKNYTNLIVLSLMFTIPLSINAQTVKKYVLMEHFTNTFCGICANSNPSFFSAVKIESNPNIHHMSIHSSIPYAQCPFYNVNKTEQDNRATFYNLPGTPRVSLNGANLVSVSDVTSTMVDNMATTSPIQVKVTETTGTSRVATVKVKTVGTAPSGTHKLYVAMVEKVVNFNAQNGEKKHYNVFRQYLKSAGDDVAFAAVNNELTFTYNYTVPQTFVAAEVYVIAFVQNTTTKAVVNSGTRFDITSAINEPSIDNEVSLSPNPTTNMMQITIADNIHPQSYTLTNVAGQVIENKTGLNTNAFTINLSNQAAGMYFLKVRSTEGVALKKIFKE
jgi:hypothetical protein